MTPQQKLDKLKQIADAMYYSIQNLTTNTTKIREAMNNYRQFVISELKESIIEVKTDNANKVEPKFRAGDWIACEELNTAKIISINIDRYEVEFIDGNKGFPHIDYIDRNFHLWTIQDAKDGNILFHSDTASNGIFIFKKILQRGTIQKVVCHCDYDSEDHFCLGEHHTCCWADAKILHPATKEQRNILFKAMINAGYTFDFEKKELKKI